MNFKPRFSSVFLFFILGGLLLVASVISFYKIKSLSVSAEMVYQTIIEKNKINEVLSNLKDAEIAQRSYIITKDVSYLEPLDGLSKKTYALLHDLDSLTIEHKIQQKNLVKLKRLVGERLEILFYVQRFYREKQSDTLIKNWLAKGENKMKEMRQHVAAMILVEDQIQEQRTQIRDQNIIVAPALALSVSIICIVLIFISLYQLQKENKIRNDVNKELLQKNRELELSNQELASFSYVSSHDLKEPLRKIQAFSNRILELETFSDKTSDYFKRIILAGERMQNLIESLLNLSRINNTELIFEKCDLNGILEDSKHYLEENIREKQAIIESDELPTIKAIPVQISQLFTNLLDNALKYSRPEVMPHIKISCILRKGEDLIHPLAISHKNYYQITFADNGIGFDQQHEQKIFELFQRLHSLQEYAGTGIGLAICKRIVSNHNGFIIAYGNPGNGSAFSIYFQET